MLQALICLQEEQTFSNILDQSLATETFAQKKQITIKVFPNQKLWISCSVMTLLKAASFRLGGKQSYCVAQEQLSRTQSSQDNIITVTLQFPKG